MNGTLVEVSNSGNDAIDDSTTCRRREVGESKSSHALFEKSSSETFHSPSNTKTLSPVADEVYRTS